MTPFLWALLTTIVVFSAIMFGRQVWRFVKEMRRTKTSPIALIREKWEAR